MAKFTWGHLAGGRWTGGVSGHISVVIIVTEIIVIIVRIIVRTGTVVMHVIVDVWPVCPARRAVVTRRTSTPYPQSSSSRPCQRPFMNHRTHRLQNTNTNFAPNLISSCIIPNDISSHDRMFPLGLLTPIIWRLVWIYLTNAQTSHIYWQWLTSHCNCYDIFLVFSPQTNKTTIVYMAGHYAVFSSVW